MSTNDQNRWYGTESQYNRVPSSPISFQDSSPLRPPSRPIRPAFNNANRSNMPTSNTNFLEMGGISANSGGWSYDDRTIQQILAQASEEELRRAGNFAYMDLQQKHLRLQGQFEGQREHLDDLKLLVRNPHAGPTTLPQPTNMANNFSIPPSPAECTHDDYEEVKFWTRSEWVDFKKDKTDRDRDCGKLGFLTDENGDMVSKDRLQEMSTEARTLFNELFRYSHDPLTWGSRGKTASAFFSNCMRQKYAEFRWCEGDWKVHAFATTRFPNWVIDVRDKGLLMRIPLVFLIFLDLRANLLGQGIQPLSDIVSTTKRKIDDANGPSDENRNREKKKKKKKHAKKPPLIGVTAVIDLVDDEYDVDSRDAADLQERSTATSHTQKESAGSSTSQQIVTAPISQLSVGSENIVEQDTQNPTNDASHAADLDATITTATASGNRNAESANGNATAPEVNADAHATVATASQNSESANPTAITPEANAEGAVREVPSDDLFANLPIPRPPNEAAQTDDPGYVAATAVKLLVPTSALSPRNLFAIDYLSDHPGATVDEFKGAWRKVESDDKDTLKKYKNLSAVRRKEAKKAGSTRLAT